MSDTEILDAIYAVLTGVEWDPGTIEEVADLVERSGRHIAPPQWDEES